MKLDDVYSIIRNMDGYKKVFSGDQFYGLGEYDVISFEYDPTGKSSINIVCPRDKENNFMYVEIDSTGIVFTKIYKGGKKAEAMDLTQEDKFFQEDTITDLGLSLPDYKELYSAFNTYYNGFLKELTIHL